MQASKKCSQIELKLDSLHGVPLRFLFLLGDAAFSGERAEKTS